MHLKLTLCMALLCAGVANAAQITLFYSDTFTSQDALYLASAGTPAYFTTNTPFTVTATFDSTSPIFQLPGFNAYTPTSATLTVNGKSYSVTDASVSIFDLSNFFSPNRYGVGLIQNPALDQEGFVADFTGATTNFTVNNLASTTFTGYNGTGFQPGSGIPNGCAATNTCTGNNFTPLHLVANGMQYLLTTGARDSGPLPAATASIAVAASVPEPSAFGLAAAGLGLLGFLLRRR